MNQFLTFQPVAVTDNDMGFISFIANTANALIVRSTDVDAHGYSKAAVKRILKAKNSRPVAAPADAEAFLRWLSE